MNLISRKNRSLWDYAVSNARRSRSRSNLCIGLIFSTVFLVLSISAFQMVPARKSHESALYHYIAETPFPVYADIDEPKGRAALSIQKEDEQTLESAGFHCVSFHMNNGDNAGCLNLYQTANPKILGVPRDKFSFTIHNNFDKMKITVDSDGKRRVPVIIDQNTAMYSLHLYGGVGETFDLPQDNTVRCEVIKLLNDSDFQGAILINKDNFDELFPGIGGYRFFYLYHKPSPHSGEVVKILYDILGDYGVQMEAAEERSRKLYAVQNTYISTFQSLGGIGLLLGTFGLAVIQSRNVFERRKELALFSALGFPKSRIILMLLYENMTLLFLGLGSAAVCSAIVLSPFWCGLLWQSASFSAFLFQLCWLAGGMVLIALISNTAAALAVLKIPVARELAEDR